MKQDSDRLYYAKQLHFHTGSEHTIDGKQFDFEMHIVHRGINDSPAVTGDSVKYPYNKLAVLGIIFDTENGDKDVSDATVAAIDKFFDSLMFDKLADQGSSAKPKLIPSEVALGELMAVVNTNDRWVYKGSLTTPPCLEDLYWNVVKTVYPMKKYHLDYYRAALYKHADPATKAMEKGTFRTAIPAGAEHDLKLWKGKAPKTEVTEEEVDSAASASLAMIILLCIAMFVALTLIVYSCVLHDKLNTPAYKAPNGDKVDVGVVPEGEAGGEGPKAE